MVLWAHCNPSERIASSRPKLFRRGISSSLRSRRAMLPSPLYTGVTQGNPIVVLVGTRPSASLPEAGR